MKKLPKLAVLLLSATTLGSCGIDFQSIIKDAASSLTVEIDQNGNLVIAGAATSLNIKKFITDNVTIDVDSAGYLVVSGARTSVNVKDLVKNNLDISIDKNGNLLVSGTSTGVNINEFIKNNVDLTVDKDGNLLMSGSKTDINMKTLFLDYFELTVDDEGYLVVSGTKTDVNILKFFEVDLTKYEGNKYFPLFNKKYCEIDSKQSKIEISLTSAQLEKIASDVSVLNFTISNGEITQSKLSGTKGTNKITFDLSQEVLETYSIGYKFFVGNDYVNEMSISNDLLVYGDMIYCTEAYANVNSISKTSVENLIKAQFGL